MLPNTGMPRGPGILLEPLWERPLVQAGPPEEEAQARRTTEMDATRRENMRREWSERTWLPRKAGTVKTNQLESVQDVVSAMFE